MNYDRVSLSPHRNTQKEERCGKRERALCDTTNGVIFIDGTKQANTTRVEEKTRLSLATHINDDTMMPKGLILFHLLCHPFSSNKLLGRGGIGLVISIPIFLTPV